MLDLIYTAVGAAIRDRREYLGITQDTLAARVGLSRTSITNIERGRQSILLHQFVSFCVALGLRPGDFLDTLQLKKASSSPETAVPDDVRELLARLDT